MQKDDNSPLEGYSGEALKLLRQYGAKIGSKVRVRTSDGLEAVGLLIPRYEGKNADNIVLKLKTGYNIGVNSRSITLLEVIEEPQREPTTSREQVHVPTREKSVILLSTGGTIASRVDYRTGAVKPVYTASDLYSAIPELGEIADIQAEVVFSIFSENLSQDHWTKLAGRILSKSNGTKRPDGFVIMVGTDTLAYSSAALSFALIGFDYPVVFVGAQRSSDRPSADSALNLKAAVRFAAYSNAKSVFVAMHENESDDVIAIHSGVRVRKNHTSRRDAFESIDVPHFALISGDHILLNPHYHFEKRNPKKNLEEFMAKTNFEPRVSLVKFYPGFDPSILRHLVNEDRTRGVIIEGTGLGHVSSNTVHGVQEVVNQGIFVGITSQCIWGHVDLNVYETGIDLLNAGVVPLGNMLAETSFAKLSWVLGNFSRERTKDIMQENLVGEMTERIELGKVGDKALS